MSKGVEYPSLIEYPLPIVTKENARSMVADEDEIGHEAVMSAALNRLMNFNPTLYALLGHMASGYETVEERGAICDAMVMTHELLRRQGEAQQMDALLEAPGDPF